MSNLGHGNKISRKQEAAIAALLVSKNVAGAAKIAGVSAACLHRWLHLPEFMKAYRDARREVVEHVVGNLQSATGKALESLVRNLNCGKQAVEVQAAKALIDIAFEGLDKFDVIARIEKLEGVARSQSVPLAVANSFANVDSEAMGDTATDSDNANDAE